MRTHLDKFNKKSFQPGTYEIFGAQGTNWNNELSAKHQALLFINPSFSSHLPKKH